MENFQMQQRNTASTGEMSLHKKLELWSQSLCHELDYGMSSCVFTIITSDVSCVKMLSQEAWTLFVFSKTTRMRNEERWNEAYREHPRQVGKGQGAPSGWQASEPEKQCVLAGAEIG